MQIVVVAGIPQCIFDAVRKVSQKKFSHTGKFYIKPVQIQCYPESQATKFQQEIYDCICQVPVTDRIQIALLYVDFGCESSRRFVESFYPFSLVRAINNFDAAGASGQSEFRRRVNDFVEYLVAEANIVRTRLQIISEQTNVHNVTPFLLPVRNFAAEQFHRGMKELWTSLGSCSDAKELVKNAKDSFVRSYRKSVDGNALYTDGILYFKSAGRHRHGHLRPQDYKNHHVSCVLNARCRLGGSYSHSFHFDCTPVQKLNKTYPTCHHHEGQPKATHVNIAPNDFVI